MTWAIQADRAELNSGSLHGVVNLCQPDQGVHQLRLDDTPFPGQLLGVDLNASQAAETPSDHYVRANDLIVTYQQAGERTVRTQLYWRSLPKGQSPAVGVELLVSVQTSLLDSDPAAHLTTRLPAQQVLCLSGDDRWQCYSPSDLNGLQTLGNSGAILFRPIDVGFSYAQLVHPFDLVSSQLSIDSHQIQLGQKLFSGHLEKGVIRRGRVRGVLLPREDDQLHALRCLDELLTSEPPLTT